MLLWSDVAALPAKLRFKHIPALIPEAIGGEIAPAVVTGLFWSCWHASLMLCLNFAFFPWVAKAELSADDAMVPTIIAVANTTANQC